LTTKVERHRKVKLTLWQHPPNNLKHASMYKKLNDLQFVIGLFFTVVSLILLGSVLLSDGETVKVNIYTGVSFLIFGLCMIFLRSNKVE
jgi:hypothetical protein